MSPTRAVRFSLVCAVILACSADTIPAPTRPLDARITAAVVYSDWSDPQPFPEGINTEFDEQNAFLSRDGLSLYFSSIRTGGMGGLDIYIAQRASLDSPWGQPVNAGSPISSANADFAPSQSIDGHLLFFASNRPGGQGLADIYVARRGNPHDDFAWQDLTALGTGVNTAAAEQAPFYLQNAEDGRANLYFNRQVSGVGDLHRAAINRDGSTVGIAEPVTEVNSVVNDAATTIRHDGKELFFFSPRTGGLGGNDIWTSTRKNVHEAWSTPVNAGAPINTNASDVTPQLTHDGRMLIFSSARPGGLGGHDIYYTTRRPISP